MGLSSGRDLTTARSYGSTVQSPNVRPQMSVNADLNSFLNGFGAAHDVKYGFGWRRSTRRPARCGRATASSRVVQTPTTVDRAGVPRRQRHQPHAVYWTSTSATRSRRAARRSTSASGTTTRAAARWRASRRPTRRSRRSCPALDFAGYDAPFTWNNVSPRAGLTYALDEARKTVAHASYARFAGQLDSASVGYMNPTSSAGVAVYRWIDLNGDHLRVGRRSAHQPVPRHGERIQRRQPDGGHLGEPDRSEPQGAGHADASSPASIASCGRTSRSR